MTDNIPVTRGGLDQVDVVIVAGGAGTRLGGASKPDLVVGGESLLDRTLGAVDGAHGVVIVGGPRRDGVAWTLEEPPGGGPAAAIAAGLAALAAARAPAKWTLALAVDIPHVARALPLLVAALHQLESAHRAHGAWIVDAEGREQSLLAIYRTEALAERAHGTSAGASMRTLVAGLVMTAVQDPDGASRDLDTWDDATFFAEQGLPEERSND